MKKTQLKQVLEAAAKLPPAKGRALVKAVAAKAGKKPTAGDALAQAEDTMAAAMATAMAAELEAWAEQQSPS